MIEILKNEMLEKGLDFLPFKESLELFDSGANVDTQFWWVMCNEELTDNGDGLTTEELLAEYDEIYGLDNNCYFRVGREDEEFNEFTLNLCPAPTIGDLIQYLAGKR